MLARLLGLLRGGARRPHDNRDQRPDVGDLNTPPPLPPRLLASVRRLEIRARRLVTSELGGEYRSAFRGAGIEFAEAREYVPGDDVRRIDWNVTARMGARGSRSTSRSASCTSSAPSTSPPRSSRAGPHRPPPGSRRGLHAGHARRRLQP